MAIASTQDRLRWPEPIFVRVGYTDTHTFIRSFIPGFLENDIIRQEP